MMACYLDLFCVVRYLSCVIRNYSFSVYKVYS